MEQILRFLIAQGSFLYADNRYRFVDSSVTPGRSDDAMLVLASPVMRIRLVLDRFQLFLDCQGPEPSDEWFHLDLIWRYLRGEQRDSAVVDDAYVEFLAGEIEAVEEIFREDDGLGHRLDSLRKLKEIHVRERFGL
jgi:hypothetical protein